ncbi:MAG: succinate dehydrogenase iron-sulfur subunit [Euryarchaeota archaeon]|nr:succinate dehydrogenase iron-sulfur subunit [Euryarchaeota archaeon]
MQASTQAIVTFKIYRHEPTVEKTPHFQTYPVETRPGLTVLDALIHLLDTQDGSLAVRYSCRHAVCGSCAMDINGKNMLACQTQVARLGPEVTLRPLTGLPVVRDLVCDMTNFFRKYNLITPYLVNKTKDEKDLTREWLQSPRDRKKIDHEIGCIMCGCCEGACPVLWTDENYLGPSAIAKAWRFIADTRDEGIQERIGILDSQYGVWRCHTAFGCVEACPKNIPLTESIEKARRRIIRYRLRGK